MTGEQTVSVNSRPRTNHQTSTNTDPSSIDTNAGAAIALGDERRAAGADRLSRVLSELCAEGSNALVTFIREAKLNKQEATAGIAFSSSRRSEAVIEIQQALRHYAEANGRQKEIADAVRRYYKGASQLTDEQALERFVDGVPGKATFELVEKMAGALKWPGLSTRNYKILESSDKECKPKDVSVRVIPIGLLDQFRQYIDLNCPPKKEACPPCDPCPEPVAPITPEAPKIAAPPEPSPPPAVRCLSDCVLKAFEKTIKDLDPSRPGELEKLFPTLEGSNPKEIDTALIGYRHRHGHSFLWDLSTKTGASSEQVTAVANKIYDGRFSNEPQQSAALEAAGKLFKLFRGYTDRSEEEQAKKILGEYQRVGQLPLLEQLYNQVYGSGTGRFADLQSLVKTELGKSFYSRLFGSSGSASLAPAA